MARYTCMVQEGQIPEGRRRELAEGLQKIGREMFRDSPEGAEVAWITIREGFAFTAGRPSTSSLVARSVPFGLADDRREEFMTRVCSLWKDTTGCTDDEIVVTAIDGPGPR